ncbi:MAG: ligase-associated DNA damage response endonuclease PdeM [Ferruginibacter sp.]|nr:ligase-associated DNA damage response endonuclease PdeM [Ferruginibacter sp.]
MPSAFVHHTIQNQNFILHHHRVLFWQEEKALILSDLHIGKTNHFRKSGIAVPTQIIKEDMQRLVDSLQFFKPQKIIIVGDLFHSIQNKEHEWLAKWRNDFAAIQFILVKGNHDIVDENWYTQNNIEVAKSYLQIRNIIFVHQIEDYKNQQDDEYIISGHIHPAVTIKGLGKQSLRFPCFYFTQKYAVLPAFGKFTGTFTVEPKKNEKVFAVVNNSVMKV